MKVVQVATFFHDVTLNIPLFRNSFFMFTLYLYFTSTIDLIIVDALQLIYPAIIATNTVISRLRAPRHYPLHYRPGLAPSLYTFGQHAGSCRNGHNTILELMV